MISTTKKKKDNKNFEDRFFQELVSESRVAFEKPDGAFPAIRAVDLDNKVEQDSLRRAIERANRRAARATYSAVATGAVSQALDTYEANLKDQDEGRPNLERRERELLAQVEANEPELH